MSELHIAADLSLPLEAVTQTFGVLGKRGTNPQIQAKNDRIVIYNRNAPALLATARSTATEGLVPMRPQSTPSQVSLICQHCGNDFLRYECQIRRPGEGKYCSRACMYAGRKNHIELTCSECGASFTRKQSEIRNQQARFCSWDCFKIARSRNATSYPKIGTRHAHRVVAEQMLGRPLRPGEIVHHKDENKRNFSAENLEVLPSQSEHARIHFSKPRRRT